jgi:hypothetical protein
LIENALSLFTTGSEIHSDIKSGEHKLQDKEIICVGQEVLVWLVEILEDAVLEGEKSGKLCHYPLLNSFFKFQKSGFIAEEASKRFNWSVEAAIVMAEAMLPLQSASDLSPISSSLSPLTVSPEYVTALRSLRGLSNEFGIRIGLGAFMSDSVARRGILSRFAKEVFKYGEPTRQSACEVITFLYRL